ncbi:carboxypeptidase B-like [Rhodnius prolixus]|uniref:Putative carboxypeptidase a n=1 Tax=Rhodnius prolixus TaxID=13249 RepID=R4G8G2_RHOPR
MKIVQYCLVFIYYFTVAISRPSDENSDKLDETKSDLDINSDSNQNVTEKVSYSGAQVLNVYAENVKELLDDLIAKGDAEEWSSNKTHLDVFVPKDKVPKIKSYLAEKNINYKIMIENVQDAIDSENPPISDEEDEFEGRKGHKMTWRSYHRLSDIYGYLDYLAETYPDTVTVGSVGNSVEGRQIKYIRISSGKPNAKKFWLDGGIHAREWISPATVTYIISEFVENRDKHLPVIDGIDFYIVPVVNPDGYEYTHYGQRLWRKNRSKGNYFCPGTDLNRNWGYMWGGQGTSGDNCREIYRGTGPFSEPETRSVSNFVLNNKDNMKAFITFHSYGQYILIPYGYKTGVLPPDFNELERVARKAALAIKSSSGASYSVGNSAKLLYAASGGADDWAKGSAGIKYAYTIELRDQGSFGFVLPAQYIIPTAKEALAAVKTVATAIHETN